ncbi:MAG TPA: hypothetical protein VGH90_10115, partial [Chthoniobacteraceae bacterium]
AGFLIGRFCLHRSTGVLLPSVPQNAEAPSKALGASAVPKDGRCEKVMGFLEAKSTLRGNLEFYDALHAMDGKDFLELANQLDDLTYRRQPSANDVAISAVLARWFEVSPADAKQWTQRYFTGPRKGDDEAPPRELMMYLARTATKADPDWALQHLLLPTPSFYGNSNTEIMKEAVKQNPVLAKQWMAKLEDTVYRKSALYGLVQGLAESDPSAAMDLALKEKTAERDDMVKGVMGEAAKQSVGAVQEALAKITEKELRRSAVVAAANVLADETNTDPLAFMEGALGDDLPNLDSENLADFEVCTGRPMVERDPAALADWALNLARGKNKEFLHDVFGMWSQENEAAMNSWIETKRIGGHGETDGACDALLADAQLMVARKLVEDGKIREAAAIATSLGEGIGTALGDGLVEDIGEKDPVLASALAAKSPPGEHRLEVEREISRKWTWRDPEAAAQWIQTLPDGDDRDAAVSGLAACIQDEDSEQAGDWIGEIKNAEQRKSAAKVLVDKWGAQDSASARTWLQSLSGVDEAWKAKILRGMP